MRLIKFSLVAVVVAGFQAALAAPAPTESTPATPHPFQVEGVPAEDIVVLGPASYEELQKMVAEAKSSGKVKLDKRQACGKMGVYLCEHANFAGRCYWGAYPGCTSIDPDPYWQTRISSVGPDRGMRCTFWSLKDQKTLFRYKQIFTYPGGNCDPDMNDKVSYFYCHPLV
ncbi:hypothetical protein BDZ91DRAFT_755122 [Kalaharituber pfeilii]|nr:hypothetical protein BDZ91DRAFT_755122 [Kalaharituber pfeilii]